VDIGFLHHLTPKRPLGPPARLKQRGEIAAVTHPGHLKLDRAHPRVPGPFPVTVAVSAAPLVSLMARGAYMLLNLHLHKRLRE
jgi:hypothetical protein